MKQFSEDLTIFLPEVEIPPLGVELLEICHSWNPLSKGAGGFSKFSKRGGMGFFFEKGRGMPQKKGGWQIF